MEDLRKKLNRVKPLIRARKSQVEKEASTLFAIRDEKKAAMDELKRSERSYIEGVEALNKERQSLSRDRVSALELGVDTAKMNWYKCLKKLRTVENKEQAQIKHLLKAERNLKSVEKLGERYHDQFVDALKSLDQKQLDEAAIRAFTYKG